MVLSKIISGLADLDEAGRDGAEAARAGFLEWVFSVDRPAQAARDALARASGTTHGPAVMAFLTHLETATHPLPQPRRRPRRLN